MSDGGRGLGRHRQINRSTGNDEDECVDPEIGLGLKSRTIESMDPTNMAIKKEWSNG